ncbi:MAG: hypothetical protein IJH80_09990 [Ruminococcus sp.]|nr:hypothetical protein [Ruminococcus sp.]
MFLRSLAAALAVVAVCMSFASCDAADSSSEDNSKAAGVSESQTEESSAASSESKTEAGDSSAAEATTDYDINGDFRAFDAVKEKWADGYSLDLAFQNPAMGTRADVKIVWQGDKAYYESVIDGMKNYTIIPGDGKAYRINEGTTTYSVRDAAEDEAMMNDLLINPAGEFDHAAIADGNVVFEYYNIDEKMGGQGQIVYGFDGETYDLVEIVLVTNGDEMAASYYYVNEISEPDAEKFTLPDISSYTLET